MIDAGWAAPPLALEWSAFFDEPLEEQDYWNRWAEHPPAGVTIWRETGFRDRIVVRHAIPCITTLEQRR